MISFIVSANERPHMLNCSLASLAAQTVAGEIIVTLNHPDEQMNLAHRLACTYFDARWLETGTRGAKCCYSAAGMGALETSGEWLCFPSDDSYYVPRFSEIILRTAAEKQADLVYCDCLYAVGDPKHSPNWRPYSVLNTQPRMGRIDKTCFIIRRELFKGFPPHPQGYRDGALIEQLGKDGVKMAKAPGILVVHN